MELKEFKKQLDDLQTIITEGIAYFSAWRIIADINEDLAQALSRYRGFFKPAQLSLKYMALLQFAKVFDHNPRTVSLYNLLLAVRENQEPLTPHAEEDDLQRINRLIDDDNSEVLSHLKAFRDQRLAHHDSAITRDTSLSFGKVKKLIDDIKDIYNTLSRGHERSTTSFDWLSREAERHTSEVIQIMCEDRDRARQRISEVDTTH